MVQPLFFQPDPSIEDSDLLGYGDLIFNDGSRQFINGDPEIASYLPPPPQNDPSLDMDAGVSSADPYTSPEYAPADPAPVQGQIPQVIPRMDAPPPVEVDGVTFDPTTGSPIETEQGAMMGGPMEGPPQMPPQGGAPQVIPRMDRPPPAPIPGTNVVFDPVSGSPMQGDSSGGASMGGAGYGTGGLQLAAREGALPPDIAAQQAQDRGVMNASVMDATGYARQQEAEIYRMAGLKRQGELDAEKQAREADLQEQKAKQRRLQEDQKRTADMDIKTDLVSAEGGIGAMFSVIGAALLGAVGSDAGLRMIDNTINQNVQIQLKRRDSKLSMLADQLGSTEQAIAAGKAALYKIAAEKVEVAERLTKADVFEAQSPSILAHLKQQLGLAEQGYVNASLGKALEKAPVGPEMMTPAQRAKQVADYGEAAGSLQAGKRDLLKAVNAAGLEGWDPKTGHFRNRAEITKLPGVGKWDTFYNDLGRLPVVGSIPQAMDNAITSQEGQDLRTALQALVEAKAAQRSPGRAPSEGDRQAARNELGFNTEKGVLDAIEKMMGEQETLQAQLRARFGSEAADTYEGRMGAQGARPPAQQGQVDRGRPLEQGKAREQLQQEIQRQPPGAGPQSAIDPIREVAGEVQAAAGRELPPEGLAILTAQAAHETDDGKSAPNLNMFGHKSSPRSKAAGRGEAALMTTEGEGAGAKQVRQTFQMFNSVGQSVLAHIDLLKRKYPDAWKALEIGDAPAYVAALKDHGYFTGSESEYLNGIMRRL